MKRIKRLAKIWICLLCFVLPSGCWSARQVDALGIMLGLGVDKSKEPGMLDVTVQMVVPGALATPGNNATGTKDAYFNETLTGQSVIGVLRDLTKTMSRKIYPAHTQVLIVGREQAEDGMAPALDLFARDHEERLNVPMAIAFGTAREVLETGTDYEKIPSINLDKLLDIGRRSNSNYNPTLIYEFLQSRVSESASSFAPLISVRTEDNGQKYPFVQGIAIFNQGRMTGTLIDTTARGLQFAWGLVERSILNVPFSGGSVQLEIIRSQTKRKFKLDKQQRATLHLDIHTHTIVAGKTTVENIETPELRDRIQTAAEKLVEQEIRAAYSYAAGHNSDVFETANLFYRHYPKIWPLHRDGWNERLHDVTLDIEVEVEIMGHGRLSRPVT